MQHPRPVLEQMLLPAKMAVAAWAESALRAVAIVVATPADSAAAKQVGMKEEPVEMAVSEAAGKAARV